MLHEADKKLYSRLGLEQPQHIPHITEDELRQRIKIEANHKWSQVGNRLICECEIGKHSTLVPTDVLLKGTDDKGLPILTKISTN